MLRVTVVPVVAGVPFNETTSWTKRFRMDTVEELELAAGFLYGLHLTFQYFWNVSVTDNHVTKDLADIMTYPIMSEHVISSAEPMDINETLEDFLELRVIRLPIYNYIMITKNPDDTTVQDVVIFDHPEFLQGIISVLVAQGELVSNYIYHIFDRNGTRLTIQ